MTNCDAIATVREFFNTVGYAGVILPTGWFGRPYDNLLQLTRSEADEQSLVLELDDQLILTFAGHSQATLTEEGLRLTGFTALSWDWAEFDSSTSHHEQFEAGAVQFVAPVG